MKLTFSIKILEFKTIKELPEAWNDLNYRELLDVMDYGDTSDITDADLKDMCLMFLSENEPEEACAIVLKYIFKDQLNNGQILNLSNEMLDENMWEEYADLSMHENFFNAHQLLYLAYNGTFPHPEALRINIEVSAKNSEDLVLFNQDTEAGLLRLLAQGMPDNTLINRLFDEQLESGEFNEAKDIIWQLEKTKNENAFVFSIISSPYWFKDVKYIEDFDAYANIVKV